MSTVIAEHVEVVSHYTKESNKKRYEMRVLLCPEDSGFSIYALNLPGVMSQGETEEEAVKNIVEAAQGAILEYIGTGNQIPWGDGSPDDVPRGSRELWIVVDV